MLASWVVGREREGGRREQSRQEAVRGKWAACGWVEWVGAWVGGSVWSVIVNRIHKKTMQQKQQYDSDHCNSVTG